MGLIIVDTTVVIDHLRGVAAATQALAGRIQGGEVIGASTVTRIEVLGGMRAHEKRDTLGFLSTIEWFAVDTRVADQAGEYARRYRDSHQGMDHLDAIVAATALVHDADLWTHNVRHYPMIDGLAPPY